MGVRKFRSVEQMPGPPARWPLDPENLRIAIGLMSLGHGLAGLQLEPGVRKFRTWDALLEWKAKTASAARKARKSR